MKKKLLYFLLALILLAAGAFGGDYYSKWLEKKELAEEMGRQFDADQQIGDQEGLITADDYNDEMEVSEVDDDAYQGKCYDKFNAVGDSIAYVEFGDAMEEYNQTGALNHLWNTSSKQTTDSVKAAIHYFVGSLSGSLYHFPYECLPEYMRYILESHDGKLTQDAWIVPYYIRKFTGEESKQGKDWLPRYKDVIEFLSAGRQTIDYYELYTTYKLVIRQILTQQEYDDKMYGTIISRLLTARAVYYEDGELYEQVAEIMRKHWELQREDTRAGNDVLVWLDAVGSDFITLLSDTSESSLDVFRDEDGALDETSLVWSYSFWLRRFQEGNADNVEKTLRAIYKDYGSNEQITH